MKTIKRLIGAAALLISAGAMIVATIPPSAGAQEPTSLPSDQVALNGACLSAMDIYTAAIDTSFDYIANGPPGQQPAGVWINGNWEPADLLIGTFTQYVQDGCANDALPTPAAPSAPTTTTPDTTPDTTPSTTDPSTPSTTTDPPTTTPAVVISDAPVLSISAPYPSHWELLVNLSWTQPSGATSYNLYVTETVGLGKSKHTTSREVTGISDDTYPVQVTGSTVVDSATFYVTAVNSAGESVPSNTVQFPTI